MTAALIRSPFHLLHTEAVDAAPPAADVLARVRHGRTLQPCDDPRDVVVELDPIGSGPRTELWLSDTPVEHGRRGAIGYAHNGEVLFCTLRLSEAELGDLHAATCGAYLEVDELQRALGYPALLRAWNYLGRINDGDGDAERYRLFVTGRYEAIASRPGFEGALPAATAIGTRGDGLLMYFLAAKEGGIQIENPRQLSAFRYPRQYGPRSPSFSRATWKAWPGETHLYVSGTASVVGHESIHAHDPVAQLDEVLRNIDALLDETRSRHALKKKPEAVALKFYLRDAALWEQLAPRLHEAFGSTTPLYGLEADICRRDLLLEIEGMFRSKDVGEPG